jgi:hypothetical protein
MPAWTARDLPQDHSYILPINPQAHTEMNFRNNVSTRILEKEYFMRNVDCPMPLNSQEYTKLQTNTNDTTKNGSKEGYSNRTWSMKKNIARSTNVKPVISPQVMK